MTRFEGRGTCRHDDASVPPQFGRGINLFAPAHVLSTSVPPGNVREMVV